MNMLKSLTLATYLLGAPVIHATVTCESPLLHGFHGVERALTNSSNFDVIEHEVVQRTQSLVAQDGLVVQFKNVSRLANWLLAKNLGKDVQTVFYPAASHDSSTPIQMFPNARTYIAADWYPFHAGYDSPLLIPRIGHQAETGHLTSNEMQTSQGQAAYILGRIFLALPNARILSVRSFCQKKSLLGSMWGQDHVSHGIVEFDQGEDTRRQAYIHLHANLDDRWVTENEWWMDPMLIEPLHAVIIKGAADLPQYAEHEMSQVLFTLAQSHGMLIEEEISLSAKVLVEANSSQKTYIPFGYRTAVVHKYNGN